LPLYGKLLLTKGELLMKQSIKELWYLFSNPYMIAMVIFLAIVAYFGS
jgi:hypothetical protein